MTTIVVVVNIYICNYYYVIGHSQVTLGFTSIVPLLQLPACGGSPQAVPAGERPLDLLDTPVRYQVSLVTVFRPSSVDLASSPLGQPG